MEKIRLKYDKAVLVQHLESHAIVVPMAGGPFTEKVVHAEVFLTKLHELTGLSLDKFQDYISSHSDKWGTAFERDEFADRCISYIVRPGVFSLKGYEKVGNVPWIHLSRIL